MSRIKKLKKSPVCDSKNIKEPVIPDISFQDLPPKFSLQYVQSKYCINRCTKDEKCDFVNAMYKRKDHSWKKLFIEPHDKLGLEIIKKGLKVTCPECASGKELLSLRFSGKKPMVGFRERDVFYVLWFDRDFSVYQH